MNRRKKNNILIGVLCCALVFMGIGYAVLNTVLNIGATANITGDFDIHFYSIERSASSISDSTILSTIDNGTGITNSPTNTEGEFTAVLQKPGDYVTYDVVVKNTGSIDGYLTFSFGDTNNNFDYYSEFYKVEFIREDTEPDIIADILQNQTFTDSEVLVKTNGTRTYKIKVTYKSTAESFPDATTYDDFECTMNLTYSQNAPASNNNNNSPVQVSSEGWVVDVFGRVVTSPAPSQLIQNGVLAIPAVDQNGRNIVSIAQDSFAPDYNVTIYGDSIKVKGEAPIPTKYAIISDQTNYERLSAFMQKLGINVVSSTSEFDPNFNNNSSIKYNLDTSIAVNDFDESDLTRAVLNFTTLDLSSATNLTTIEYDTFRDTAVQQIIFNNTLTTIEHNAFQNTHIASLVIPSSVESIGTYAFAANGENSQYKITTLDLSNATSLTDIGQYAFEYNAITSLSIPSSVISIESSAFYHNAIATLNLSAATSLTTIGYSAFSNNAITTVNLSAATSLTTIVQEAFMNNSISTLTLPSSISNIGANAFQEQFCGKQRCLSTINIPMTKSNFESNVTVGYNWFDAKNDPSMVYSDVTETCVPGDKDGYVCTPN